MNEICRTHPLQRLKSNSVFHIFIKAKEHSRNRVKVDLMSQFQPFWVFFFCRHWCHLSLIFSTLIVTHLDKNEKQYSIPNTLICNFWKIRAFLSKNFSVRHWYAFQSVRKGKSLFRIALNCIHCSSIDNVLEGLFSLSLF